MATKRSENQWRAFQEKHEEVITITKLQDSLLHIRAWKKSGASFIPALRMILALADLVKQNHLDEP